MRIEIREDLPAGEYEILPVAAEPGPDPIPPPLPEPIDLPDPVTGRPATIVRPEIGGRARVVHFESWWRSSRYMRGTENWIVRDDEFHVDAEVQLFGGGRRVDFRAGRVDDQGTNWRWLRVDGARYMEVPVTQTQWGQKIAWRGDQPVPLPHGGHLAELEPVGDEVSAPYPFYVDRGEGPVDWMPVVTTTQTMVMMGHPFRIEWVPARWEPQPAPINRPVYIDWQREPEASDFVLEHLIPADNEANYPIQDERGNVFGATKQSYRRGIVTGEKPTLPIIDGPRGVCNMPPLMAVMPGTAHCPETGGLVGNLYCLTSHSLRRTRANGDTETLVGAVSTDPPTMIDGELQFENRGDWSDVPADRRFISEGWGLSVDPTTTAIDTAAARVPDELNMHPHFADAEGYGVALFITDRAHKRILKVRGSAVSHKVPRKVTEWVSPGLGDWWAMIPHPDGSGRQIASDRDGHRVCVLEERGGEGVIADVLVQGFSRAYVDRNRSPQRNGETLAEVRKQPTVLPEGLAMDGDWLLIASSTQRQVRRFHMITGDLEVAIDDVPVGKNFTYLQIAACRGYKALCNWTVDSGGLMVYRPDGTRWHPVDFKGGRFPWRGRGPTFQPPGGYGSAPFFLPPSDPANPYPAAIGWNTVEGGIHVLRLAQDGDSQIDPQAFEAAQDAWISGGYDLRFGPQGYGAFYGEPLPWGESDDIDYFLQSCGHSRLTA